MKRLGLFICGATLFAAAALGAGYLLWGAKSILQGSVAFGLTFVPAAATFAWVLYVFRTVPDMQLLASLGGSGIRMGIALGGGYFLTSSQPQTFATPFWCWMIFFYLGLLGFEITLLVQQPPKADDPLRDSGEKGHRGANALL